MTSIVYCSVIFGDAICLGKSGECRDADFSFELAIKAYPDSPGINLGDTIWFEINSSTRFKDDLSGNFIDYDKATNLGAEMYFAGVIKDSIFAMPVDKFDFILKKGIEVPVANFKSNKEYQFPDIGNRYQFLLGIIPKEKGTFSIFFYGSGGVQRSNDNCTKASFAVKFADTDQHNELSPYLATIPVARGGDYFFTVK